MNNLILSSVVFVTGTAVWLGQHASLERSRSESLALTQQLALAQNTFDSTTRSTTDAQTSLAVRRTETKSAQTELDTVAQEPRGAIPTPPLDPAGEGAWPTDRPYFYLAKKHLGKIGYPGFAKDHHLSDPATLLFGLTPSERAAVDRASDSCFERVNQLQSSHAERLEAKPGVNSDNHRELSYRIPAMTNEMNESRTLMATTVREVIGEQRARLLLEHVHADFEQPFSPMMTSADNATVTLEANRKPGGSVDHQLKIATPDGGYSYISVSFPLSSDSELWNYRHLFGDQPLIPLPTSAQQDK